MNAWVPPSLAAKLVIGARVRIRLHQECPRGGLDHGWDVEVLDGLEGTIVGLRRDDSNHPYIVTIDGHRSYYAAAELEPIDLWRA